MIMFLRLWGRLRIYADGSTWAWSWILAGLNEVQVEYSIIYLISTPDFLFVPIYSLKLNHDLVTLSSLPCMLPSFNRLIKRKRLDRQWLDHSLIKQPSHLSQALSVRRYDEILIPDTW